MSSSVFTPRPHPVVRGLERLHADLDDLADAPVWSLGDREVGDALTEATRLVARAQELELRLAAHAERVEADQGVGATSTASWWAHLTRLTRPEAHRRLTLAQALDGDRHTPVREALAEGRLRIEQAQAIVTAVDALPDDVDPAVRTRAEATLLEEARHHDAIGLRRLGRHVLDVVAPEVGEAQEARALEREEEVARQATRLVMRDDGHGQTRGWFTLPTLHGEALRKVLLALAAPRRHPEGAGRPRATSPQRLGRALCELIERYPADRLPDSGGVSASVVVTMTLETLTGGLKAASLDTGGRISAGEARRLACQAGVIPAVLGGPSEVLDLGRKRRFHSRAQRLAMALEQGGCTAEGCDWPPGLCDAHHAIPWGPGGPTSVADGRLLCPRHHRRAHDPR